MRIKTKFNIGDIVTFDPILTKGPLKGMIIDLFIYLGYDRMCNKRSLRIIYVVRTGEKGYHVQEDQIISKHRI